MWLGCANVGDCGSVAKNGGGRRGVYNDTKNYYTIRLISDIVIIDNEIYINYLNINSGGNSSLLNNGAESDTITPTDGILVIGTTK